jgi:hypothetical protein
MKGTWPIFQDVPECVDVTGVHIHVRICRELVVHLFTSTPLVESGVQLPGEVSSELMLEDCDLLQSLPVRP